VANEDPVTKNKNIQLKKRMISVSLWHTVDNSYQKIDGNFQE
jgi:hypothetical protein